MLFTDAIGHGSLGFEDTMKTTLYIIVIMLSFFLISCNRREKQLERRLVEIENSFNQSNEELYKSVLDVQNLIEEN